MLLPLPTRLKFVLFRILLGEYKSGLAMDVLAPTIAHRYTQEEVDTWLAGLDFGKTVRTIKTDEIYRKAFHKECSAIPFFLDPASPPYWHDIWAKENYENLLNRKTFDPNDLKI